MYHDMFLTEDLSPKELERRRISVDLCCIGVAGLFLTWCADDLSWDMDILLDIQEEAVPDFMKESIRNS